MPELAPFAGLRYQVSDLSRVAAPPYDVVGALERERLEELDPHNAVRLILPRDRAGGDRYSIAAATLERWTRDGILRRDAQPCFTVMRMRSRDSTGRDRTTVGVIGALALPDEGEATILPHERTLPKAKSDRLALLRATRANLDPIWGLSLSPGLSELLGREQPADAWCHDGDCLHEAWVLSDADRIDAVRAVIARSPIVLADGHHRFETAKRYRNERGGADSSANAVMALVVELAEEQLSIEAIHRVLRVPEGREVRNALATAFEVIDAGPYNPRAAASLTARAAADGAIALLDRRGLAVLRPRDRARRMTDAAWPAPVARTGAALAESAIRPLLADAAWDYRAGLGTVTDLVRAGTADAALLLTPVSVDQTRAVAQAGGLMPQKTTYFHPKPRTGFVFRTLA